jgi:hypothetical protein
VFHPLHTFPDILLDAFVINCIRIEYPFSSLQKANRYTAKCLKLCFQILSNEIHQSALTRLNILILAQLLSDYDIIQSEVIIAQHTICGF